MKSNPRLIITVVVLFCLSLGSVAPAAYTVKTLYLDGNFVGTDVNSTAGLVSFGDHITIGSAGDLTFIYNEYIGSIDEFALYAGVMDADTVKAHYDAKDSNSAYYAIVDGNNPLLWLRFEDANTSDGYPAANSGSVGTDGQYIHTGGNPITAVPGINAGSSAINFPNTAEDGDGTCIDVNDPNEAFCNDLNGSVTIELWVNFIDLDNPSEPDNPFPRFFQRKGAYGVYTNNDPNTLGIFGGDATIYIDLPYDINDEQWHHIVVTYDSNYIQDPLPDTNSYEEEVQSDNPILWLRFNDDIPQDSSGNDHWVSYGSAVDIKEKTGGIVKSVYFDKSEGEGIYGVATMKGPNAPPMDANEDIGYQIYGDQYSFAPDDSTFEMWYRLPSTQKEFAIFFQQLGAWTNEPRAPGVSNQGGNLRVFCGSDAWEPGVSSYLDKLWHHLVVTYDEEYLGEPNTMYVELYVDGYKKSQEVFHDPNAKLGPELTHLMVGAENDIGYTYNPLFRHADEFAIYEGILPPDRILAHYAAWQPKTCAELIERGPTYSVVDMNEDCKINLYDFALFASQWANCNNPPDFGVESNCLPNWL